MVLTETRTIIPTEICDGTRIVPFIKIHEAFADTCYGRKLADEIRFGPFKPKEMSNARWKQLLGPDVDNLHHMDLMRRLSRFFISACINAQTNNICFSQEDMEDLQLTAVVHDWGEAEVGDLAYGTKNSRDEEEERDALRVITDHVIGEGTELHRRIMHVSDKVVFDPSTRLGSAFHILEKIGYMTTGLRSRMMAISWNGLRLSGEDQCGIVARNLNQLTHQVLGNQLPELLRAESKYPAVSIYLDRNQIRITEIFDNLPDVSLLGYEPEKLQVRAANFERAREVWQRRSQS